MQWTDTRFKNIYRLGHKGKVRRPHLVLTEPSLPPSLSLMSSAQLLQTACFTTLLICLSWVRTQWKYIARCLFHAASIMTEPPPPPPPPQGMPLRYPPAMQLSAGDAVKVQMDPDVFKTAQDGHGGWNDKMAEVGTESLPPALHLCVCVCVCVAAVHRPGGCGS